MKTRLLSGGTCVCGETIVPHGLTGLQLSFNFTVRPKAKGGFVDERHTKFNTFEVEMLVPYRICTEISEEREG